MKNLYIYNETFTNGFESNLLNVMYFLSILCGIYVIISKNPILSILYLIGLFMSIAISLMIMGLNFIGLSYLLVYVGAVSILFLFILMLINIRISELLSKTKNSIPLIFLVFILLSFVLLNILPVNYNNIITENTDSNLNKIFFNVKSDNLLNTMYYNMNTENINYTSSFFWDGNMIEFNPIASMGSIMYTSYPMWLIVTSLILLLAMIGVIVITLNTNDNNNVNENSNKELY